MLIKQSIKDFSEYVSRKLKCHQHRMTKESGVSLETILKLFFSNVFHNHIFQ